MHGFMGYTVSDGKTQTRVKVASTAQPTELLTHQHLGIASHILVCLRLDGVSQVLPKSVAPVFVAAISWDNLVIVPYMIFHVLNQNYF